MVFALHHRSVALERVHLRSDLPEFVLGAGRDALRGFATSTFRQPLAVGVLDHALGIFQLNFHDSNAHQGLFIFSNESRRSRLRGVSRASRRANASLQLCHFCRVSFTLRLHELCRAVGFGIQLAHALLELSEQRSDDDVLRRRLLENLFVLFAPSLSRVARRRSHAHARLLLQHAPLGVRAALLESLNLKLRSTPEFVVPRARFGVGAFELVDFALPRLDFALKVVSRGRQSLDANAIGLRTL